jgi:succinate dehydrogenase/fumarate reductase flavoprotein subunit
MVAQEGKALVPVYHAYAQAGFDCERDLLQHYNGGWFGTGPPQWRAFGAGGLGGGGLVVDWDLKTSLDGLYAAGEQVFVSGHHAAAATTGRYAGRHAARYARGTPEPRIDRVQTEAEKNRVYAPLARRHGAMEWKELNAGVCRIMQDYCGAVKNEELLTIGLTWLAELEAGEARAASARNPHELMRLHEVYNIITNARIILEASRRRKASNDPLGFRRLDASDVDPADEQKWICIRLDGEDIKTSTLPIDYHGELEENYKLHRLP